MLKKTVAILFVSFLGFNSFSQTLTPSDADSKISFAIKNMGLSVVGIIKGLKGKMDFDPKNLQASMFDVTVDVNTINTDNKKRDAHLMKDDFFDATKYPVISIKTTSIQAKNANTYFAKAALTMHGVTKNIQFDFIASPIDAGYNFKAQFTVNRIDYGIGGNSMTMGDEVKVSLDVMGKK